jgi:hypothetical protein
MKAQVKKQKRLAAKKRRQLKTKGDRPLTRKEAKAKKREVFARHFNGERRPKNEV